MNLNSKIEEGIEALENSDYDRFWTIISSGKPEDRCHSGENALHIVCGFSKPGDSPARINLIKRMLEWKIDINQQDVSGETPLYLAVNRKDYIIIPFLLANRANRKIKITPVGEGGTASATSFAGFLESRQSEIPDGQEIPMTKMFMLNGAKIDEFFEDAPEIHVNFGRNPVMIKFYQSILNCRQISLLLVGLHKFKKSPLFKVVGKDCIILISREVYKTRGESCWVPDKLLATHL